MKRVIICAVIILAVLLAAAAVYMFGVRLPYQNAESFMPGGTLEVQQSETGTWTLTWPEAEKKDRYWIRIYEDRGQNVQVHYLNMYTENNSCLLPKLPNDRPLTISISTVVDHKMLWEDRTRLSETPLQVTTHFKAPYVEDLSWTADPDNKAVVVSYRMAEGETCQLYAKNPDGTWREVLETQEKSVLLTFGDDKDFAVPGLEDRARFQISAYRREEDIVFYGQVFEKFAIKREDLLGRNLNPVFTDEGNNVCTITWEETKGEYYQVQRWDPYIEDWEVLAEVPLDGERSYTSQHMPPFQVFTYRVVAVGGQVMEDSPYAAISEEMQQITKETPVYCTIWPTKNLKIYADLQMSEELGKVKAGTALCVLDEKDGKFLIRQGDVTGYIDSNSCMINLPEFLMDLCQYDITNSYASLYMVHEFTIPEVTNVVTVGYEKIMLESGEFLVPLLYPTALRLAVAARAALEENYILKIYDAFRPQKATLEIYELTEKILKDPLPELPFREEIKIEELELPEPKKEVDPATGEEVVIPLTYEDVMVAEPFTLSHFLAKGGSMHNYGLALDLTIVDLHTEKELEMQSSMHDLSHYSAPRNNKDKEHKKAAKKLESFMTGAGFVGLVSEWWHFQDNVARDELDVTSLFNGVTATCWMADNNGWRYRRETGWYYKNCQRTINGVTYTFDALGYVVTE